jgi:hypothetical protein
MTKIKQLLQKWPQGTVATDLWLHTLGIGKSLKWIYQKGDWVKSIGHGAIIRSQDLIDWKGAVFALQNQLNIPVHIGGKTALEMQGYGHFVKFKESNVYLYAVGGTRLPKWFTSYDWGVNIVISNTNFLITQEGLRPEKYKNFELVISSPERALLELLYQVPRTQSLDECYLIIQGLMGMRPSILQILLENCTNVKVKRLALFFGEYLNHPWIKQLDITRIDLGKGARQIVKGGYYEKKYKITIPKEFHDEQRF